MLIQIQLFLLLVVVVSMLFCAFIFFSDDFKQTQVIINDCTIWNGLEPDIAIYLLYRSSDLLDYFLVCFIIWILDLEFIGYNFLSSNFYLNLLVK